MRTKTHAQWALVLFFVLLLLCSAALVVYPEVRKTKLCAEAASDGGDLNNQIEILRQLAASGESEALAEVLDCSMVYIPAGDFVMGSDQYREDERPQKTIYLDAFEIDRYEVTNAQYQRFLKATGGEAPPYWHGNDYPFGQANYPVVGVTWKEADAYCAWAGKGLPTEAQWEKACRGTHGGIYPWGDTWDYLANVDLSAPVSWAETSPTALEDAWALLQQPSGRSPGLCPVASYPGGRSPYDVFDLAGNASEWMADWYNWDGYWDLPDRNPIGLGPEWNHSIRGSAWYELHSDSAWVQDMSRCSARNSSHVYRDPRFGFRCARSAR